MLKIALTLLIATFFWPAQALTLSPQMGLHEPASLAGHLTALVDTGGTLRIEDVVASGKASEFSALPGFLGAGYTADTYWLRFTLQRTPESPADWLIEVSPPYLDEVTLFVPRDGGGFHAAHLGDLQPYTARPVPHRSFVFPLALQDAQPVTLYLRVKTTSTMLVRVHAWQYTGLLAASQADVSLYSIYFGILVLALLSNLIFWFWLRERVYLNYCGYLAMLTMAGMATGGFASQWLFPHSPLVADRLVGVGVSLVFLLGTNFFIEVLRLREHFQKLDKFFDGVLIFYALCALAAMSGHYGLVAPWLMWVSIVNTCVLLAGPWLLWRGNREYLFYTLAFTANFAATPIITAKLMGWITINASTDYIGMMGAFVHIVLLNFAVVDRMRLSERKMLVAVKLTAELAAERDAAQQQRQFVAMVSHEFRTPLAVIDATAQSVEIACSQAASTSYEFIAPRQEKIRRAVRRMVSLLDNFLTSERLDFHKSETNREVLDLRDLANEAAKNWSHLLHDPKQLQLVLGAEPAPVFTERSMMSLALSNLIDNAIKYSPLGSPITLRVGHSHETGWIEVEDHGVGVSATEIGLIFDKFYRSGDAQVVPGAGLGLYLVRSISRSQGGEIDVESTTGKGSRFRMRFALVR